MDTIKAKEYLINTLHKRLIDSDERDDSKGYPAGYVKLAQKYWPEEFDGTYKIVHHIDGDHSNNVVTNLVVLTPKEHALVHKMFDEYYKTKKPEYKHKKKPTKIITHPEISARMKMISANQPRIHGKFAAKH